jgi:hypothetical protein
VSSTHIALTAVKLCPAQGPDYADYLLQQQVEDPLRPLPVLRLRVPQFRIDDLEGAGEREADATGDLREPLFGFGTINQVERRQCCQVIEDRL